MKSKSKITLANCQIKSAEKFRVVAQALDLLEKETFIQSGLICFSGMFICPDIDLMKFFHSQEPTERLLAIMCIELHVKRYGKSSRKEYLTTVLNERIVRKRAKERRANK